MVSLADMAFEDEQPCGLVLLACVENLLDLRTSDDGFDDFWTKNTRHFLGDIFGEVINHIEIFEPGLFTLRNFTRLGVRADVEADDRRL